MGGYTEAISNAFAEAELKGAQLRKDAASGNMWVSGNTLMGLISDQVRDVFTSTMTGLWTKAWDLGYDSANQLLGTSGSNKGALQGFLDTEGTHWVDQVARTGLGNSNTRSEMIARTEVARAMNAAAIQCYRDNGVSHKHMLIAPDDACQICVNAKNAGIIPLDAPFPKGGVSGPLHVQCRCIPAPAGMNFEPPQAHIKKTAQEDPGRLAWILLRAKDEDGKYRFLLQQRSDGSWGMPGGTPHVGEDPWQAAFRETTEEIGDLPPLKQAGTFHHVEDDGETQVYLYLCDTEYFQPKLNGSTPEETQGAAWFRRKEVGHLNLTPKFREDWEDSVCLKDNAVKVLQDDAVPITLSPGDHVYPVKALQNIRTENGEWLVLNDPDRHGAGLGARWPYPKRPNMEEVPENNRDGGGQAEGEMGAVEPPNVQDDLSGRIGETRIYPRGSEDDRFPQGRREAPPATRFPSPGTGQHPRGGIASSPGVEAQIIPGGRKSQDVAEKDQASDARLADPAKPGGPSDYNDPNPVDPEHVYVQLAKNFPPDAIQWVKQAKWIGPIWIPWSRVDTDDKDKWAASHQPEKVKEFENMIKLHDGHVAPSILVQEENSPKAFIVDGHHRAVARENLKQDVLAYLGHIDGKDRQAALETHAKQFHSGADPQNKAADPPKG